RPDQVACERTQVMQQDLGLFVRVGVEADAALLLEHAREPLGGIERDARKVGLHEVSSVCQVTWITPAVDPAGTNSASRVRRFDHRCGWYRSWNAPISDSSSAPAAISGAQSSASWAYPGRP